MTPDSFATHSVTAGNQFEAWSDWYREVLDITPMGSFADGFEGEIRLWRLGGLAVTRTTAPPVTVARNRHHLRRDPSDHWILSYCARGAHHAITAGVSLEVPARVPFLWSLGQEFVHERTHMDRLQFILSRDAFADMAPLLDAACGSVLDTPLGRLLGDYMMALEHRLPAVSEADFPHLAKAVGSIVRAAIAPSDAHVTLARQQVDFGRRERVRRAVQRHLRTPTLTPKSLARLVGMSRSNLYRLFEGTGGVAGYIQSERLLAAHANLADPTHTGSISALAEELCFADASSFNRSFKRAFGCSPGEVRSAASGGLAPPPIRPKHLSAHGADFADLLHRL